MQNFEAASPEGMIRVGFFGDGPWAVNALQLLIDNPVVEISFVALRHKQPDDKLKRIAQDFNIISVCPENINSRQFLDWAEQQKCGLYVSMSYDQIFRKTIIDLPDKGIINCHAGKLPFYRGRNVLNWALINDEKEFGITVHFVDEGIDTGDIILQQTYPITDNDDYGTLLQTAHTECARLLKKAVTLIIDNKSQPVRQSEIHPVGMYCTARGPGDETLDWSMASREVFNFVRAICVPGPMARTWLRENEVCINKVEIMPGAPCYKGIPGAVLFSENDAVYVKTGDTFVKVVDYKKQGRALRVGDRLTALPGKKQ